MPTEEPSGAVWPPAPDLDPPVFPNTESRGLPTWMRAVLAALLGAIVGAITLVLALFLFGMLFLGDDADGPLFIVLAVMAAVVCGAVLGMIAGLVIWFIRRRKQDLRGK